MVQSRVVGVTAEIHVTDLSGSVSDPTPVALDWIQISGVLTCLTEGIPLSGSTVELWVNGFRVGSTTTGADGDYLFEAQFEEGHYDIYTRFPGDAGHLSDDSPLMTVDAWRPTTSLVIGVSPTSGTPPFDVTVSGVITRDDTDVGIQVLIHLYKDGVEIASKFSGVDGRYSFTDTIDAMGTFTYYTRFEGNLKYQGCEGDVVPCPACRHPVDVGGVQDEVACRFCDAVSEVVVHG